MEYLLGRVTISGELFKLNILNIIINENMSSFVYVVDSIDLWRRRLGHVNISYIKK